MEISLGHGAYRIEGCRRNGRHGVLIRPAAEQYKVNEILPNNTEPYMPEEDAVIIWMDNIEGARVLQDQINVATLELNGYEVTNAEQTERGTR